MWEEAQEEGEDEGRARTGEPAPRRSAASGGSRRVAGPIAIVERIDEGQGVDLAQPPWPGALATAVAFGEALRRREAGVAYSYLEPGARLLTADGTEVSDPESVGFLAQLTAPGSELDIPPGWTIVNGDIALCTQSWRLRAASDDPCFERASSAFFVLRRSGSRWRVTIAASWG